MNFFPWRLVIRPPMQAAGAPTFENLQGHLKEATGQRLDEQG